MKASSNFTKAIKGFLDDLATKDKLFKNTYENPKKNINDCVKYILGEVYKSKMNAYANEDIFQMAVHYYDEESIEISNTPKCTVVVSKEVNTTESNLKVVSNKPKAEQKPKPKPTPALEAMQNQLELF